jgi:hypothetical protein
MLDIIVGDGWHQYARSDGVLNSNVSDERARHQDQGFTSMSATCYYYSQWHLVLNMPLKTYHRHSQALPKARTPAPTLIVVKCRKGSIASRRNPDGAQLSRLGCRLAKPVRNSTNVRSLELK